jgi:DnaJ-class molecular chaperone
MTKTHYDRLGVDENASDKDIKKAYRKLSLRYHPDHNSDKNAHDVMTEINEAYTTLNDDDKRKEYDDKRNGRSPNTEHLFRSRSSHGMPPEMADIFNSVFGQQMFNGMQGNNVHFFQSNGNGRTYHQQQKPSPMEIQITLNINECYNGKEVTVNFPRWTIMNNTKVTEQTTLVINIPPGISEKDTITFENEGHIINDSLKGDIIVKFVIINNTEFKRVGNDLHIKRVITLKEALCGFSTTFTHLNGKTMSMKNISHNDGVIVTQGYRKIATGLGMKTNNGHGNLVIEFDIDFPKSLTDDQINSISKILE